MTSRRRFVLNLGTVAGTLATGTLAKASIAFAAGNDLCKTTGSSGTAASLLSYAAFAAQIGSSFRVTAPWGETVQLHLKKVELAPRLTLIPGRRRPPDANNEKFSLLFAGPQKCPLPSAIHSFEHTELGRFEMYFGEIGLRNGSCIRYEAVFNQTAPNTDPGSISATQKAA